MTGEYPEQAGYTQSLTAIDVAPRHPSEMIRFAACLAVSLPAWGVVLVFVASVIVKEPAALVGMSLAVGVLLLLSIIAQAIIVTRVRGNGLKVGPEQLPRIHEAVVKASEVLGTRPPETYVLQSDGLRTAITRIFLGSRILALSSNLVDDQGEGAELEMVVGRELAHFRFRHLHWGWFLFPSMALPLLYPAWKRSTEYTADRCGLLACQDAEAAERAIYITAAGSRLGRLVSPDSYRLQIASTRGFFMTVAYLLSGEPSAVWRVTRLLQAVGGRQHVAPQMPRKSIAGTILCLFVPGATVLRGTGGAGASPLVTVALIALLISILLPSLARARELAKRTTCNANLRLLNQTLILYAEQNGGRIPTDPNAFLNSFDISPKALVCPSGGKSNYLFVPPPQNGYEDSTPVVFEPIENHGEEGGNVGFGNGETRFLQRQEFERTVGPYLRSAIIIQTPEAIGPQSE